VALRVQTSLENLANRKVDGSIPSQSATTLKGFKMLKDVILEVGGMRWKVREAKSEKAALAAIASARVSGSVGAKNTLDETLIGRGITVLADVVKINSDDSEVKPYTLPY
jgi:hypothetical protein